MSRGRRSLAPEPETPVTSPFPKDTITPEEKTSPATDRHTRTFTQFSPAYTAFPMRKSPSEMSPKSILKNSPNNPSEMQNASSAGPSSVRPRNRNYPTNDAGSEPDNYLGLTEGDPLAQLRLASPNEDDSEQSVAVPPSAPIRSARKRNYPRISRGARPDRYYGFPDGDQLAQPRDPSPEEEHQFWDVAAQKRRQEFEESVRREAERNAIKRKEFEERKRKADEIRHRDQRRWRGVDSDGNSSTPSPVSTRSGRSASTAGTCQHCGISSNATCPHCRKLVDPDQEIPDVMRTYRGIEIELIVGPRIAYSTESPRILGNRNRFLEHHKVEALIIPASESLRMADRDLIPLNRRTYHACGGKWGKDQNGNQTQTFLLEQLMIEKYPDPQPVGTAHGIGTDKTSWSWKTTQHTVRWIVHAIGPDYRETSWQRPREIEKKDKQLRRTYMAALHETRDYRRVAVPHRLFRQDISRNTPPPEQVARIALSAIKRHIWKNREGATTTLKTRRIEIWTELHDLEHDQWNIYERAFRDVFGPEGESDDGDPNGDEDDTDDNDDGGGGENTPTRNLRTPPPNDPRGGDNRTRGSRGGALWARGRSAGPSNRGRGTNKRDRSPSEDSDDDDNERPSKAKRAKSQKETLTDDEEEEEEEDEHVNYKDRIGERCNIYLGAKNGGKCREIMTISGCPIHENLPCGRRRCRLVMPSLRKEAYQGQCPAVLKRGERCDRHKLLGSRRGPNQKGNTKGNPKGKKKETQAEDQDDMTQQGPSLEKANPDAEYKEADKSEEE